MIRNIEKLFIISFRVKDQIRLYEANQVVALNNRLIDFFYVDV